ncbi:MAG: hypothetical protein II773_06480, partial [Oscillospiraceae bacterium]|nr:hypothetical protein [Oscillospiraceae bacterium]
HQVLHKAVFFSVQRKFYMKKYKFDDNVLFDDNETAEDLLITDLSDEELDEEFRKIFGDETANLIKDMIKQSDKADNEK